MNPLQRMELHKADFTQNDQIIYEYIMQNPSDITHLSTSSLAELCGVSQPALSRFVKGLGYARYQDFRAELIRMVAQQTEQAESGQDHLLYFTRLYQLLHEAEQLLTEDYLHDLGNYLCQFPRIFASGIGKSRHAAELLEILIAFAQQDPDGNGKNDTYGLTRSFAGLEGLWSWFNCFPDYWVTSGDGSVIPGYLDRERMLDGLNWLRKAYQGGGVDPEWQGDVDGFVNETFGAYTYNNDPFWQNNIVNTKFGTAHPELGNPLEIIGNFTALPAHEGVAATTRPYFMDGMCVFSYKCSDAVMERVLAVMDWALTEEGAIQTFYGVEGIDYTWKEDGTINQINGWTNCTIGSMTSWNPFPFDTRFLAFPNLPEGVSNEDMINWNLRSIKMGNEASHNPAITFNLTASLVVTEERANFVFDHTGGLLKIVTGTDEVETMYDAFIQDAYDSGLQAVIDAQNKAMMK